MRIAALLVVAALTSCAGPQGKFVPLITRCETGVYDESEAACFDLAAGATDDKEKLRFVLLGARSKMWRCKSLDSPHCEEALDILWRGSDDPQEVTTVLALSQKACVQGVNTGCIRARDSAWAGRGTPIDGGASMSWHQKCSTCAQPWSGYEPATPPSWLATDADTRLDRARKLASLGLHAFATSVLARELATHKLEGHEAEARALLQSSLATRWTVEVEPLIAREPLQALAAAERLVALEIDDRAIATRRDRIRDGLAAAAIERMTKASTAGRPLAAWFHGAHAKQLGASVTVAKVDVVALWSHLATRPQLSVPASCEWMSAALATSFPTAGANLPVTANLTCRADETTSTTNETYTYTVREMGKVTKTVPGRSYDVPIICRTEGKHSYNEHRCGSERRHSPDTTIVVEEMTDVSHEGTRAVSHRTSTVSITGSLVGGGGSIPITFRKVFDDTAYQTPHGSKSFGASHLVELQSAGTVAVVAGVQQLVATIRKAEAARQISAATAERDPLAAEEHSLRAVTLGDPGERVVATYKLAGSVAQVLEGGPLVLPAVAAAPHVALPAPTQTSGGYPLSHYPRAVLNASMWDYLEKKGEHGTDTGTEPSGENPPTNHKGGVYRLIERTRLVWYRSDRTGQVGTVEQKSTVLGARIERGWHPTPSDEDGVSYGVKPGFLLGGGGDGDLGGFFEGRIGASGGLQYNGVQLLATGGVGFSGMGVRDTVGGSQLESKPDIFFGADLRLGLGDGISFDGRAWTTRGGPLGSEKRFSGALLHRRASGFEIGVELSQRTFGDQDERITGFGALLRAPDFFDR